ncbi:hypothetical protein HYS48_05165 [Candidatus Woesearchaeota archaeon]|nr:hypothetical protein [Candidatus Woesearchaeota archaeon]
MDIESIQKVNRLTKELVQRGMAGNMEEAALMAEQFLAKGSQTREIRERMDNQHQPDELNMQLRKLNYQLNEQAEQFKAMQEQLSALKQELNQLRLEGSKHVQAAPVRQEQKPGETPASATQQTLSTLTPTPAAQEAVTVAADSGESLGKKLHAKVGGYKPEDVAIEKIFYCGPKD